MKDEKNITDDYEYSRSTYYELIDKGRESLDVLMEVARETEHPRAFEVLSGMIKNMADINDKLMDLNKKTRDLNKEEVKAIEKMFRHFNKNRFSIVLACRQSGKSISSVVYLLWYAIFHPEKTIAVLANKGATAREMLARVTLALENLPFFLQPGCKALNKGSIEFSNNSRIIAAATSGSSIRGMSVNLLFLDEFAFVERAAEFYTSTYPVISSGKETKVIITSTANGIGNPFQKIWEGAMQEVNEFKPFRVDWWDVPGRNKKWKEQTIANTSQLQFDQEFGNTFYGTGDTLINAETLMNFRAMHKTF